MAMLYELTAESLAWIASWPATARETAERWPPNLLYRLKTTAYRCTIYRDAVERVPVTVTDATPGWRTMAAT